MDKLLTADNLAIVVLAAWVVTLKIEHAALRKENSDNWKLVERMRQLIEMLFQSGKTTSISTNDAVPGIVEKSRRKLAREEAERTIERLERSFEPFPPMEIDDNPTVPDDRWQRG